MKNILVLGAVTLDIAAYVKELPKGNEDFEAKSQEYRLSGNGYTIHQVIHGFGLETDLIAPVGTGIYGEQVREMALKEEISLEHENEEIEGSTYHLIAEDEKQTSFVVPGSEYEYDSSYLEYMDIDDYEAVVLTADYLTGEDGEDLIDQLSWLECPVYFVPGGRIQEVAQDILEQAIEISSTLFLTNEEVQVLSGEEENLEKGIQKLLEIKGKSVIVYSNEDGLLYVNNEERLQTQKEDISALDERRLQCFASYLCAVCSGVDIRNAMVFAMEFTKLIDHSHGKLDEYDWNEMKQRLVRMITWKS